MNSFSLLELVGKDEYEASGEVNVPYVIFDLHYKKGSIKRNTKNLVNSRYNKIIHLTGI